MLNKPAKVANLRTSHGDKPEDPRPARGMVGGIKEVTYYILPIRHIEK